MKIWCSFQQDPPCFHFLHYFLRENKKQQTAPTSMIFFKTGYRLFQKKEGAGNFLVNFRLKYRAILIHKKFDFELNQPETLFCSVQNLTFFVSQSQSTSWLKQWQKTSTWFWTEIWIWNLLINTRSPYLHSFFSIMLQTAWQSPQTKRTLQLWVYAQMVTLEEQEDWWHWVTHFLKWNLNWKEFSW